MHAVGRGAWPEVWRSRLPESLLLLPIFWARLVLLTTLPMYHDEAIHINLARIPIFISKYFDAFVHARWLNVMLLTLVQPLGPESLWISRAVTVILSLLTAAGTYYVAKWAGGVKAARLALLIYAVMPFAYFYDRQAMSDPVMAAFGALGFVFSLRAVQHWHWRDAVLAGLFFALSTLTKFSGGLYLAVPLALVLIQPKDKRLRAFGAAVVQMAVCLMLFGAVFFLAWQENGGTSQSVGADNWCHSPQCSGGFDLGQTLSLVQININYYLSTIVPFYTIGIWLLAILALAVGLRTRNFKWLFLGVPAFLLVLPYVPIADLFPPRYYIHTVLPLAALAGIGFEWLRTWLGAKAPTAASVMMPLVAALVFLPALVLEGWQALNPFTVPLARWEQEQYAAGWPASTTAAKMAKDLEEIQLTTGKRVNVIVDFIVLEANAYWSQQQGMVQMLRDVKETQIVPWVASGDPLCLLEITPAHPLGDAPYGLVVERVAQHPIDYSERYPGEYGGAATASLLCAVGVTEALSNQVSNYAFGDPASAADAYRGVADAIRGVDAPILSYPSNQVEVLKVQSDMDSANLRPLTWPVNDGGLKAQIAESTMGAGDVWGVFAFEDRNATSQQVQAKLASTLFRYEPQYYGPVKVLRYKTGVANTQPLGANFGEIALLRSTAVLPPQDDALRVALDWQALSATPVSYKVFTHVFDANGQLVAQRDDYPHADLTPTNSWQPDDEVQERYVVMLPTELAAGRYTVRVGVYNPDSGERLLTQDGADSVEVGTFEIY